MKKGELLFMHSTQTLKRMQARTDTRSIYIMLLSHNPDIFSLLKLLNDGKALLSTPQQSAAGFKKTELMTEDARLAWCKGLMLLYPRQPSSGMIKTVSIIIQMRREVNKLGVKVSAVSCLVTLTGSKHQCWWRLIYFFYSRQ